MKRVQRIDRPVKTTREASKKQEVTVAKVLGGSRQPNSGATPFAKGDIKLDDFLVECKTKMTESASIAIKRDWLEKNETEALFVGKKYSALAFNFGPSSKSYYVIDEELFKTLVSYLHGDSINENV